MKRSNARTCGEGAGLGTDCAGGGEVCALAGALGSPLRMAAVKKPEMETTESP